MANKKASSFWKKHFLLALAVLCGALLVLQYIPDSIEQETKTNGKSSDNISDNMEKFYKEFRMSSKDPIQEEFGEFVVAVELPEASQTEQLVAISSVDKPPEPSWDGEFKSRSFAKDTTIRIEAMKYASEEGMKLIWDLNQDFIIRQRFITENSLLGTLDEVAGAIDANFVPKVNVYFCNEKRTIVIAAKAGTYVKENCKLAGVD